MGQLSDWAKKQSKTIILEDGEVLTAVYQGFKIGANPFDPEKEIVFYRLTILQDGEEVTKLFKSTSGKAARFFDACPVGTKVRLNRHGTGSETTYDFDVVNGTAAREPGEDDDVLGA